MNALRPKFEFADGVFMIAAAPLDGGDSLADLALRLEITEQKNVIGQIADVYSALQRETDGTRLARTIRVSTPRLLR